MVDTILLNHLFTSGMVDKFAPWIYGTFIALYVSRITQQPWKRYHLNVDGPSARTDALNVGAALG